MSEGKKKIALVGNPNSGKTSLFNALTGMNQKVGNFPGVTVDKKVGGFKDSSGNGYRVIDLPGIYSLSPKSLDEEVACKVLFQPEAQEHPDGVIIVIDASNLKRNLFLATQVIDLGIPAIVALNMSDIAEKSGVSIDNKALEEKMGVPVLAINAKSKEGVSELKDRIDELQPGKVTFFRPSDKMKKLGNDLLKDILNVDHDYRAFKLSVSINRYSWLSEKKDALNRAFSDLEINPKKEEILEISERYRKIGKILPFVMAEVEPDDGPKAITAKLDKYLTHPVYGFIIFVAVFFLLFQAVFSFAAYPMDMIDYAFGWLSGAVMDALPTNMFTDFLANGIVAGIGGIVIFVPQIMILFGLVTLLEDTGYMARVSFMNDRFLRSVGMNGRSVVPLVSGFACAIPAIMAARNIDNWKERMITIMVTPLMSCSARLPVYVFLVGFIVPEEYYFGFISLQGLFMLGLYLLGLLLGIGVAWVFNLVLQNKVQSSFILELPTYRAPRWGNVWTSMINKGYTFVTEAGKVILIISILLWGLSSFGPGDAMQKVDEKYDKMAQTEQHTPQRIETMRNTEKLENSYAGIMGRAIEPAIQPLGFDWRIGIAVVTSFAAREVFVGTMSILYSVEGEADNIQALKEKMKNSVNPRTGEAYMSIPTASSLLIFYVIAMQCMSTLAITKRETNSWKWPILQFSYLTALAYIASFITYQALV
ncbi:ferrous iron transport protein B [Salibacter halophilus]|uniref:Ferrous iron transport protein B n=1 Tax=Salibacter halophilus TaxID=1803916 RepID=A0A6N6M7U5_9FLAO|nr:ferrous iron transport protein B [Salibacter halophilus]KAB1064718.1 ferrous iron transport protein B [Salibacter halophilus]